MGSQHPSMVVNIRLKFDESLFVQPDEDPVSTDDTLARPPTGQQRAQLQPLILRRGAANVSFIMARVPRSGSVELPGYRQAGQFQFDFAFKDLPVDPRTVRSAAIEVHLGAVSADDFAAGMRGPEADGRRRSILATRDEAGQPNQETLLMEGIVDIWSTNDSNEGSSCTIKGRDLRGVLLDTPLTNDPRVGQQILGELDMSLPIDQLLRQLLSYHPSFGGMSILVDPSEWPNGVVPAVGDAEIVPRARRGARGRNRGGNAAPSSGGNLNFWDLVVRFSYLVGAIPYFRGSALVVRPSRSIYEQARAGNPFNPTPFAGGEPRAVDAATGAAISPPLRFRRLVYGRDIEEISFDRKFAGWQKPRVVRCVSNDLGSTQRGQQRVIVGVWPPQPEENARARRARRTSRDPGTDQSRQEIVNIPVAGVRDVGRLTFIAKSLYEEVGRGEVGGSCTTRSLGSFGGDNADPDLLHLMPGDGIEFMTDTRNLRLTSTRADAERLPFEDQMRLVGARLGDENLARVIVATSRGQIQDVQRFFRVANVRYSWNEGGVQIDFDFQNYMVVRAGVDSSDDVPETNEQARTVVPPPAGAA